MIQVTVQAIMNRFMIFGSIAVSLLFATASLGDKIYLKDGSVELSDRIWESDQYIHFILKGTQGVEIRYAREIVERIERLKPDAGTPSTNPDASNAASDTKADSPEKMTAQKGPVESQRVSTIRYRLISSHQRLVRENRGLLFYDPRRPMRYWAMRNSKHRELKSALNAMAKKYERTTAWVETYMGQDNELGKIHHNLARQYRDEATGSGVSKTQKLEKLEENMPLADDTADGRREPLPQSRHQPFIQPQTVSGIRFYDPRRVEKYWSGQMTRHHTLKEALNTLAEQYGVTPSWIETHMGDTNELSAIHLNIQKSLNIE